MRRSICLLPVVLLALFSAAPASATALLSLMDNEGHYDAVQSGATTLTLDEDNTIGPWLGSPWRVAMSTGNDDSAQRGVPSIRLDVSSTAERAGVLFGLFSINDVRYAGPAQSIMLNSFISTAVTAGIDWQVCVDGGNQLGARSNCSPFQSASLGALQFTPVVDNPFSLTIVTRFTTDGPAEFSATTSATVPEPASVLLIGFGVAALALVRRRA